MSRNPCHISCSGKHSLIVVQLGSFTVFRISGASNKKTPTNSDGVAFEIYYVYLYLYVSVRNTCVCFLFKWCRLCRSPNLVGEPAGRPHPAIRRPPPPAGWPAGRAPAWTLLAGSRTIRRSVSDSCSDCLR